MNDALTHLRDAVKRGNWGYHRNGPKSSEPTAFACLALCVNGLTDEALVLADWLSEIQSSDGSVGVTQEQATPAWPTSLAILAWQSCDRAMGAPRFTTNRRQALSWALQTKGKSAPQQDHIGHNTTLIGWSWAAATHSWLEPTCMFTLALRACDLGDDPRTREAVRLVVDRLLEAGGCNFGNTRVLGQATLPHIQSTGLAMLTLSDLSLDDPRISRSLDYLEQSLNEQTATASLCFALLGLTAHDRRPANAEDLLRNALGRELEYGPSCYKLALLALADRLTASWLPRESVPSTNVAIS